MQASSTYDRRSANGVGKGADDPPRRSIAFRLAVLLRLTAVAGTIFVALALVAAIIPNNAPEPDAAGATIAPSAATPSVDLPDVIANVLDVRSAQPREVLLSTEPLPPWPENVIVNRHGQPVFIGSISESLAGQSTAAPPPCRAGVILDAPPRPPIDSGGCER